MNDHPAHNAAEDVVEIGDGRVVTRWLDDEILEAAYSGYLSEALIDAGALRFWVVAGPRTPRFALVDTSLMTGYSNDVARPGKRWLTEFKARGGEQVVVVTTMNLFRMLVSTLMFAAGAPVRFVSTRDAALTRLRATKSQRISWS